MDGWMDESLLLCSFVCFVTYLMTRKNAGSTVEWQERANNTKISKGRKRYRKGQLMDSGRYFNHDSKSFTKSIRM